MANWEGLTCDIQYSTLYPCIAFAETELKTPSVVFMKLTSSSDPESVVESLEYFCLDFPIVISIDELMDLGKKK